ncbi:NAD-dependent epimerase/dehydratase family protein (plasmid) [Pseudanabaena biceps]|nr:NAD-dependent epimerase/dehydratase family protein [Pseudanabaena biceps]
MTRILITGATGFLGSHLCQRLASEGHQVRAFVRPNSNTSHISGANIEYAVGDMNDVESLCQAVRNQEVVIHTAAHLTNWGQTRTLQTKINVEGTQNLIAACKQHSVQRLIHVSSVAAIGIPPNGNIPADETFQFNLQSSGLNYHLSKWRSELAVLNQQDLLLEVVVVNPGTIFGSFGSKFRGGEMIEKVCQSSIVPYFLGGINIVHVEDVVDGICRAITKGTSRERYILSGENVTFRQIVEITATHLGVKRIFVPIPAVVTGLAAAIQEPLSKITGKRPRFTYEVHYCAHRFHFYNSQKAKDGLGYSPRNFQEILEDYMDFRQLSIAKAKT